MTICVERRPGAVATAKQNTNASVAPAREWVAPAGRVPCRTAAAACTAANPLAHRKEIGTRINTADQYLDHRRRAPTPRCQASFECFVRQSQIANNPGLAKRRMLFRRYRDWPCSLHTPEPKGGVGKPLQADIAYCNTKEAIPASHRGIPQHLAGICGQSCNAHSRC
jgi:hypothetical protein